MKYDQRGLFLEKKIKSPIIALEIASNPSLQQITEPDDVWKENILLLKRPEVQSNIRIT